MLAGWIGIGIAVAAVATCGWAIWRSNKQWHEAEERLSCFLRSHSLRGER